MRPPERGHTHTQAEWQAEGERRFGPDMLTWKFACPNCGNVAAIADFKPYRHMGADANAATLACIGLFTGVRPGSARPCHYLALKDDRALCPVAVLIPSGAVVPCFAFAEPS